MQKIGIIERKSANVGEAIVIGAITTVLIAWGIGKFIGLDFISYLNEDKIWEILILLPTVFVVFVVHEYIHVAFFLLFGKGKAKIKVSREKSVGAVIMHQVNEEVFYSRWQMLIILLSPLVLLTIGLLFLIYLIPMPFMLYANIVLNALGSSIDLYVCYQLIVKYKGKIQINFDSAEVKMNIYH